MGTENEKTSNEDSAVKTNGTVKIGSETPKVERPDDKHVVIDGVSYVVQTHVDDLVGTARREGKDSGKSEAQKAADAAAQQAREEALKEQGQYKDLYEAEMKKVEDLNAKLTAKDAEILKGVRTGIAAKYGLSDIEDRIKGETAEEMEADAKALGERMGIKVPVSTQTGQGAKPAPNGDGDSSDDDSTESQTETKAPKRTYAFQTPGEVPW